MTDVKSHANLVWSVAERLRGTYKQSDYGKVILPLVVLRRLDQALEPTKQNVVARSGQLRAQGIDATVETPAAVNLPLSVEALVFRVAQESLRNVAQHSGARAATLTLTVQDEVVLQVVDDGAGFDVDTALGRRDGHVGLRVLRDVATEAGALLQVGSAPGGGTRVRLEVPLP
jgi:signal transduction histidine kinase